MDQPLTILTIGHSTRTAAEFAELLVAHRVRLLVDVRAYPGSRRLPQFGQDALAASVRAADIAYLHMRGLGGRRRATPDAPHEWGGGWRNASFRAYAQYVQSEAFQAALDELVERGRHATTAIMCSESVPWRCHRWLVSDSIVARGHEVEHILDLRARRRHVLSPFACVHPDGRVTWPPADGQLSLQLGDAVTTRRAT